MNKQTILISLIFGFLGGCIGFAVVNMQSGNDSSAKIAQYYSAAASTLESPHHIRKALDTNEIHFVLVDVRTEDEYIEEQQIEKYKALQLEHPNKDIVIYCYSSACLTGRKVGNMLAENGIFVKEMSVGWNEWRYDFNSWNYPNEWDLLDPSRYVVSGPEPGVLPSSTGDIPAPCRIDGEFGC